MRRRTAAALVIALCAGLVGAFSAAPAVIAQLPTAGPSPQTCAGPTSAAGLPPRPGPPLRFGITPGVVAGQVGPPQPAKPDDPARDLDALRQLRRPGAPFVLRLNRFFWSDGEAGIQQFLALAHHYTAAGFLVELQLRYSPPPGHAGDMAGWTAWLREVVDRFGSDSGVVGMQVTNEVNFTVSPDSSDGANTGAKQALVEGVEAAKEEARSRGYGQLKIGFNWVYRSDPNDDNAFWTYIARQGGPRFLADLDWVGLDAYPGTLYPPAEPSGGYGDGMANALGVLRDCYMAMAGIPASVPIYIEENGYPTGNGRPESTQLEALREMVGTVSDLRGTYNVSDYRWFNLRDADSSAPGFQQHYGLLHDDYSAKPAFAAYRDTVATLGLPPSTTTTTTGTAPASPSHRRGPRLIVRERHGRLAGVGCLSAPLHVKLTGIAPRGRHVVLVVDHRRVRARRRHPLHWLIRARSLSAGGVHQIVVAVSNVTRHRVPTRLFARRVRVCPARGR